VLGEEFILNTDCMVNRISIILRGKKSQNFRDVCVKLHSLKKLADNLLIEVR